MDERKEGMKERKGGRYPYKAQKTDDMALVVRIMAF